MSAYLPGKGTTDQQVWPLEGSRPLHSGAINLHEEFLNEGLANGISSALEQGPFKAVLGFVRNECAYWMESSSQSISSNSLLC